MTPGSCGAEAMGKVWLSHWFPGVRSPFCPAWKRNPWGLLNQNAIVPSATVSRRTSRATFSATSSVATDARKFARDLVALAGVVVPVELVRVFTQRDLVRAVAIRLVLGQAAFAEPLVLAVDHVLGGL